MKRLLKTSTALVLLLALLLGSAAMAVPTKAYAEELDQPEYEYAERDYSYEDNGLPAGLPDNVVARIESQIAKSPRDTALLSHDRAMEAKYAEYKMSGRLFAEPDDDSDPEPMNATIVASGKCGAKAKWELNSAGSLVISGTGKMYDYDFEFNEDTGYYEINTPWRNYLADIKKIVIKSGITAIGRYAFDDCFHAASVTIPSGVKSIGDYAFSWCFDLTSVKLPEGLTTIGIQAFHGSSLTTISIPASVKTIGSGALSTLGTTTSIKVASDNSEYTVKNGVLFDKYGSILIAYPSAKSGSYTIPADTYIIEEYAFYYNSGLTSVKFPKQIVLIGWGSFLSCTSLTSITIDDADYGVFINGEAFASCTSLTTVKFGKGVDGIPSFLFEGCSELKTLTLPGSIGYIDSYAFNLCDSLTNIYFRGSQKLWDSIYKNPDGNDQLNSVKVGVATSVPGTPKDVKASTVNYRTVKVTWKKVSGAEGYSVTYSNRKNGPYFLLDTTANNTITNKFLYPGNTYYFKVQAFSTIGGKVIYSNYSDVVSAKLVPLAPKSVKAVSTGYDSVKLTWSKVSACNGYYIYYSSSKDGTYKLLKTITSADTLTYKRTGLTCGKTYYFKVRAYKTYDGQKIAGKFSSIVSAKPIPGNISLTLTQSGTSVKLSWDKVAGATGYQVYRSTSKNGTYTLLKSTSKLNYTDTGLKKGKTYWYKVRAFRTVDGKKVYGNYKLKSITLE